MVEMALKSTSKQNSIASKYQIFTVQFTGELLLKILLYIFQISPAPDLEEHEEPRISLPLRYCFFIGSITLFY